MAELDEVNAARDAVIEKYAVHNRFSNKDRKDALTAYAATVMRYGVPAARDAVDWVKSTAKPMTPLARENITRVMAKTLASLESDQRKRLDEEGLPAYEALYNEYQTRNNTAGSFVGSDDVVEAKTNLDKARKELGGTSTALGLLSQMGQGASLGSLDELVGLLSRPAAAHMRALNVNTEKRHPRLTMAAQFGGGLLASYLAAARGANALRLALTPRGMRTRPVLRSGFRSSRQPNAIPGTPLAGGAPGWRATQALSRRIRGKPFDAPRLAGRFGSFDRGLNAMAEPVTISQKALSFGIPAAGLGGIAAMGVSEKPGVLRRSEDFLGGALMGGGAGSIVGAGVGVAQRGVPAVAAWLGSAKGARLNKAQRYQAAAALANRQLRRAIEQQAAGRGKPVAGVVKEIAASMKRLGSARLAPMPAGVAAGMGGDMREIANTTPAAVAIFARRFENERERLESLVAQVPMKVLHDTPGWPKLKKGHLTNVTRIDEFKAAVRNKSAAAIESAYERARAYATGTKAVDEELTEILERLAFERSPADLQTRVPNRFWHPRIRQARDDAQEHLSELAPARSDTSSGLPMLQVPTAYDVLHQLKTNLDEFVQNKKNKGAPASEYAVESRAAGRVRRILNEEVEGYPRASALFAARSILEEAADLGFSFSPAGGASVKTLGTRLQRLRRMISGAQGQEKTLLDDHGVLMNALPKSERDTLALRIRRAAILGWLDGFTSFTMDRERGFQVMGSTAGSGKHDEFMKMVLGERAAEHRVNVKRLKLFNEASDKLYGNSTTTAQLLKAQSKKDDQDDASRMIEGVSSVMSGIVQGTKQMQRKWRRRRHETANEIQARLLMQSDPEIFSRMVVDNSTVVPFRARPLPVHLRWLDPATTRPGALAAGVTAGINDQER